jgi:hypothetical protein
MKNPRNFLQIKPQLIGLMLLLAFLTTATSLCNASDPIKQNPLDLSSPVVYKGTGTITKYFQTPCVNQGQVTITVNTDKTVLLVFESPDVNGLCETNGDRVIDKAYGVYEYITYKNDITFSTCNIDDTTGSRVEIWSDISGSVTCYYKKDKDITITFTATRQ